MPGQNFDTDAVVSTLNSILEIELSGVVRYTHYSLMVFGHNRLPIVNWLRQQAQESLTHSQMVGELITHLGAHPSLNIGELLETHQHDITTILSESLTHEQQALSLYWELLNLVKDRSVMMEEFARQMISEEEKHTGELRKMLGAPGEVKTACVV
ncbi:MAG: bacterioferritin [Candidatus Melainabacteria bacterium]